jgi:hypothetical protein
MDDEPLPPSKLDLAAGWSEADLNLLERLATWGFSSARTFVTRQAKAEKPAEAVKLAGAFVGVARGLRLTLTLQATALTSQVHVLDQVRPEDGSLLPPPNLDIAPGWSEVAVSRLKRLADLAMQIAENLISRQNGAGDDDAIRLAAAFNDIARCVRLTLTLKAKVLAGDPDTLWRGAVEHPQNLDFNPDPDDPGALTHQGLIRRAAAEVRIGFEHYISDGALMDFDDLPHALDKQIDLRERLERAIERESERESFRRGSYVDVVHRLCQELDIEWAPTTILRDEDGLAHTLVIARPSDERPTTVYWRGQGPYHDAYMAPWPTRKDPEGPP